MLFLLFFTFHGGAILQPNPLDSCYVNRVNTHVQSKDFVYFADRNFNHCPVPKMANKINSISTKRKISSAIRLIQICLAYLFFVTIPQFFFLHLSIFVTKMRKFIYMNEGFQNVQGSIVRLIFHSLCFNPSVIICLIELRYSCQEQL